jgi:quercetin dioxygenase-like cupin family protein
MNEEQGKASRGMPAGEAVNGLDFIQYQDDSVVSREIMKRNTGNVTLFAFDAGQGLSEHTSSFDALVHLLDGEAEIVISGKPLRAKAGDLVLMPAQQPHALKAVTKFKMLLMMIRS